MDSPNKKSFDLNEITDTIILDRCLNALSKFPSNSIDFIFTSPPYANNRKQPYAGYPIDGYVEWFLEISNQLNRILKSDGSFILNIKERAMNGERQTYVLELILAMKKEQGWKWTEEYIWHKKNCYPGHWPNRFRDAWERCLHFTKNGHFKMYQDRVRVPMGNWANKRLTKLSEKDYIRDESQVGSGFGKNVSNWLGKSDVFPSNVLLLPTECTNRGHSASFPVALPEWFIKLFTNENDIVLDPFIGSGTTAVACVRLKRHYVGIELVEQYLTTAENRIKKEVALNASRRT